MLTFYIELLPLVQPPLPSAPPPAGEVLAVNSNQQPTTNNQQQFQGESI